ncbi:MAG: acylphosphatase [Oligoflexia bacterium]|nr:acylphosphatase [Oligoflexia bacterium]
MNEKWRYTITGTVQGVGYRNSILHFVNSNLKNTVGQVKNNSDGSVEIIACGPISELKSLEDFAYKGSRFCNVENVVVEKNINININFTSFKITF